MLNRAHLCTGVGSGWEGKGRSPQFVFRVFASGFPWTTGSKSTLEILPARDRCPRTGCLNQNRWLMTGPFKLRVGEGAVRKRRKLRENIWVISIKSYRTDASAFHINALSPQPEQPLRDLRLRPQNIHVKSNPYIDSTGLLLIKQTTEVYGMLRDRCGKAIKTHINTTAWKMREHLGATDTFMTPVGSPTSDCTLR